MVLRVLTIAKVGDDPDEWRGFAQGRRPVYVRYDRGHLTVNVGNPREHVAGMADTCVFRHFFDDGPGQIGYRHLKDLTRSSVEWPAQEMPETDEGAIRLQRLHTEQHQSQLEAEAAQPMALNAYLDRGRLMVPRDQPNVESLFTTSPDHDCERMGCTRYAHVVLRR